MSKTPSGPPQVIQHSEFQGFQWHPLGESNDPAANEQQVGHWCPILGCHRNSLKVQFRYLGIYLVVIHSLYSNYIEYIYTLIISLMLYYSIYIYMHVYIYIYIICTHIQWHIRFSTCPATQPTFDQLRQFLQDLGLNGIVSGRVPG